MLASNYSKNLNINLNNSNAKLMSNENKLSAFTPTVTSASSSLDYLYQAITLIEENKNNTGDMQNKTNKSDDQEFNSTISSTTTTTTTNFINKTNGCANPCCNCRNIDTQNRTKSKKRQNESESGSQAKLKSKNEKQIMSKYKKIKTYDSNYPDFNNNSLINKPNVGASRLEKAKQLSPKSELRLNISNDPLTPISSSSLSPQSVKSVISPSASPFINTSPQANQQQNAFNYYPIEIISNLLPFYFSPFTNNSTNSAFNTHPTQAANVAPVSSMQTIPNLPPTQTNPLLNSDPNYLQNLLNTIYSLANYHQLQQLMINPINSNNLILYSIQQQLQHQLQQQRSTLNISNPVQQSPTQPPLQQAQKKTTQPLVKSKLISYINESDIENKVNEHFRRSLGSKYLKISNRLNKSSKPKKRTLSDSCDTLNSTNTTNRLIEEDNPNEETNLDFDDLNYDDEETFIEYTNNDEQTIPLSPVSTVSASDSYSRASINDDDLIPNEILHEEDDIENEDEITLITSAATNNTLLFSPVSSNSVAETNY